MKHLRPRAIASTLHSDHSPNIEGCSLFDRNYLLTFRPEPTLSSTSWPRSGPMMCDHITHPEHWPGDAGAVAESLAPFAVAAVASEVVLRQIADMLHLDYDALPTQRYLGAIHPSYRWA